VNNGKSRAVEKNSGMCYAIFSMPLYEYECAKGHRFEAIQKVTDKPLRRCYVCAGSAKRAVSQPTLLHNRGVHVFDRVTKDDALRARPSSLKSFKKDKF
jgi:putative regulatory protein, FmdB family